MAAIDDVLAVQGDDLDTLEEDAARRVLRAFEDARRELRERLERSLQASAGVRFTDVQLAATLAQIDAGVRQLSERLHLALDEQVQGMHALSARHLAEIVREAEPAWSGAVTQVEADIVARLASPTRTAIRRSRTLVYGSRLASEVQAAAVQAAAQNLTITQTVDRLTARTGSAFSGRRGRALAELHTRMQLNTAYTEAHVEGAQELVQVVDAGPETPDPLLMRISAYKDRRTTAISYVLDGMTKAITDPVTPWKVRKAEVIAAGRQHKASTSGIVWRDTGAFYVGNQLPAHYGERDREHVWRASWAAD